MINSGDLNGFMAMMPAFTTDDGASVDATETIDLNRLSTALNRMIADGAGVISTCGSFGEFHTLLWEEWKTLNRAAVEINDNRVPLFVGCTALNSREALRRLEFAQEIGAYGVLVGVPFYFPSTIENAVGFYKDIAERFPKIGIMLYHNPALHNVKLAVPAFEELVKQPNIIGMKDSHRDTLEFMKLREIINGRISVFCNTMQFHPFHELGAEGFWSIDSWMGPEPLVALYKAVISGDTKLAKKIYFDISPVMMDAKPNYSWRETAAKIAIRYAGYCDPGPLRPPFVEIPATIDEAMRARADKWQTLRTKYNDTAIKSAAE